MIKIWHFSDTHTYHGLLEVPKDIDIAIFSGDCSNPRDPYTNEHEVRDFLTWYASLLDIPYKIFVAGNHDSSIEKGLITKDDFEKRNIHYLENDYVELEGLKIWGSPHSPQFGDWSFMKNRSKLDRVWQSIPDDTDIVVVHSPAKGVLDLTENRDRSLEQCGCSALKKRILKIKPKLFCFGHIHNFKDITNSGTCVLSGVRTVFSNGTVVTDREFGRLSSNGNIIHL